MSLLQAGEARARIKSSGVDHEIIPKTCGGDGCGIPNFCEYGSPTSEWPIAGNLATFNSTCSDPCNISIQPPLNLGVPGFELSANAVALSHATWDPSHEVTFPSQLEQSDMHQFPPAEGFLRDSHPFGLMSQNDQHVEVLSYDCNYRIMHSSPSTQLPEAESLLTFEDNLHSSSVGHSAPSSNLNSFIKTMRSQEVLPYATMNQETPSGFISRPSGSQPLPMLSSPVGLEYYSLETGRAPSLVGFKGPLSVIHHGGIAPHSQEILPVFQERGASATKHDCEHWPSSTANYPATLDGFLDPGPSSSHLSWDVKTRSSSSPSSSYVRSPSDPMRYPESKTPDYVSHPSQLPPNPPSSLPLPKIGTRSSPRESERNITIDNKQNCSKAHMSRDQPTNQKRVGSLLDIHHLTNHVPRRRLTVEQEQILLRRFAVQEYLSKREMEELAEKLKIPTSQLRTWFGNRRSKLKAAARQKAKMEAGMGHLTDAELKSLNKRN